jgi:chemotaxis regulatin CheY-phosphate phosphatase CheZ
VSSHWSVIDGLVRDIGSLAGDVHLAERTLATDPRTHAARRALDTATDAVCSAIEDTSAASEKRATTAVEQARTLVGQLGLTIRDSHNLAHAAHALIDRVHYNTARAAELHRLRLGSSKRRR